MSDYRNHQMLRIANPSFGILFTVLILFVSILFHPISINAQISERLEIPSSFNPVGSGARALGMGGAFIAIADDATAASWNPGGLIQLEKPEISGVGAYFRRIEDLDFGENSEASGSEQVDGRNVNYLSAAYPFSALGRNMIVSVNYQHLYDLYREWDLTFNRDTVGFTGEQSLSHRSEGSLSAIGIAYCIEVTPKISLGVTMNIWDDSLYKNQWEAEDVNKWSGMDEFGVPVNQKTIDYTKWEFSGINYNLGLLWTLNSHLTLGAVFKAPFTADLKRSGETFEFEDKMETPIFYDEGSEDQSLDMPMSYGIGIAYRFSDNLTASLDVYRTEWDEFILTDADGNKTSAISFEPENESDVEPTTQIRIGTEYLLIGNRYIIPFRGGLFYDPAPAEGSPDHYYGFSLGSGFARSKIVCDAAYQFRFGNGVSEYIFERLDFSADVKEHIVYASVIFHF